MEHTALSTVGLFDERPMAGHIGVEVHGIDVLSLDDRQVAELRRLWLDNLIVVFVGQDHVDRNGLASFAGRFGPLYRHPLMMTEQSDPVHAINIPAGGYWHSDVTFAPRPPMATMLHAQTLPPKGGDTLWANMYLAYESLSAPMRSFLDGLSAVHDLRKSLEYSYRGGSGPEDGQQVLTRYPPTVHPVVRVHPFTGRKALFVNRHHTVRILELSDRENEALLPLLFDHVGNPEFQFRTPWKKDWIAVWDNWSTQHLGVPDYHSRRLMQRIGIAHV